MIKDYVINIQNYPHDKQYCLFGDDLVEMMRNPRVNISKRSNDDVIDELWDMRYDVDDMIEIYNELQTLLHK